MMTKSVDFGKTAADYRQHRLGFPLDLFIRLKTFGIGLTGQDIVDFGTGTGTLANQFARQNCKVIGLDIAQPMLDEAQKIAQAENLTVTYQKAAVEKTALPDRIADVVSAGQCWHWFQGVKAAQEAYRLLRRNGSIVICHVDWLPLPGTVVAATEQLISRHNPTWPFTGGNGFYGQWAEHLYLAGFIGLESFSFDLNLLYSPDNWRGRIRASSAVAASLAPEQVKKFDEEHQKILERDFPENPLHIPHRVFALIGRKTS